MLQVFNVSNKVKGTIDDLVAFHEHQVSNIKKCHDVYLRVEALLSAP